MFTKIPKSAWGSPQNSMGASSGSNLNNQSQSYSEMVVESSKIPVRRLSRSASSEDLFPPRGITPTAFSRAGASRDAVAAATSQNKTLMAETCLLSAAVFRSKSVPKYAPACITKKAEKSDGEGSVDSDASDIHSEFVQPSP
jgi:hypothetical protein